MPELNGDGKGSPKPSSALEEAMREAMEAVEAEEEDSILEVAADDDEDEEEEVEVQMSARDSDDPPDDDDDDDDDDPPEPEVAAAPPPKPEPDPDTALALKAMKERWLRAAADLENYKRRAAREKEDTVKFGNEKLVKDFLPVLDDLDRTLEVLATSDGVSLDSLLDGVRLVQKKFLQQLEKHGVTTFETTGKPFDPMNQEAVQQAHSDVAAGGVAQEMRRGFLINERLLRPAMVVVSLGPENPPAEANEPTEEDEPPGESESNDGDGESESSSE